MSRQLQTQRRNLRTDLRHVSTFALDWLNDRPSKARSRTADLIKSLKIADQIAEKLRVRDASIPRSTRDKREWNSLYRRLGHVNRVLAHHRGTRSIAVFVGCRLDEFFLPNGKRWKKDSAFRIEMLVISHAVNLLRLGSIQRLRTCRVCNAWFYGMTDHQVHCNPRCRQRYFSRDPGFRERRRKYMKQYRRDREEGDRRLREISRRPG